MDDAVADLYRLPAAEFVAARDALAKARRAAGDKEEAAAIKALRRPTVAAWALNQVAASQPELVAALIEAGDDLRAAQDEAIAGGGGDALREAMRARREAGRAVAEAAAAVLGGAGSSASGQAAAVGATIDAVAADPELAARLRAGTLSGDEPEPGDDLFGLGGPASPPAKAKAKAKKAGSGDKAAASAAKARKALDAAQAKAESAELARAAAADAADEAERQLAEVRLELASAEEAAANAAKALAKAEEAAADASAARDLAAEGVVGA